jgi:TRAP-type C4-dicarboxylate transport system permease large subunit
MTGCPLPKFVLVYARVNQRDPAATFLAGAAAGFTATTALALFAVVVAELANWNP